MFSNRRGWNISGWRFEGKRIGQQIACELHANASPGSVYHRDEAEERLESNVHIIIRIGTENAKHGTNSSARKGGAYSG